MLDSSDFDKVDQVLPFPGAIFDVLCGREDSAEVTAVFTLYLEFSIFFLRRRVETIWFKKKL